MDLNGKKIYFASDFHLGTPNYENSLIREKKIVSWLNEIESDAHTIYLIGDIFDFWFEYKHAIPKGFARLQGKIAEITDAGIPIHVFTGNHDMWMFDYLKTELGAELYRKPIQRTYNDKTFFIGHGDGLGPGDHGYKFIKKVFENKLCQWLFARLHPNFGIGLANFLSRSSRAKTGEKDAVYLGDDQEWLAIYCKEQLQKKHFDYFIFGHRHLPIELAITDQSTYLNTGDWLKYFTYAVFDGKELSLKKYPSNTNYFE